MKHLTKDNATGPSQTSWVYNGYDTCATWAVAQSLSEELLQAPAEVRNTYLGSLEKVAPCMEMSLRGIYIDENARRRVRTQLENEVRKLTDNFNRMTEEIYGETINTQSPKQVLHLLKDLLRIPGQVKSANQATLAKVSGYFFARPFVNHILAIKDRKKQITMLSTTLEKGRMMYNLNVAGTETGRLSCRKGNFGYGTNCQNIDRRLRRPFQADPGKVLINIDLEQADSRNVGAICLELFNDPRYLDACESGDLHTAVSTMVWPTVVKDRETAGQKFSDTMTYRDIAKRVGHGTNYLGAANAIAGIVGVPAPAVREFQRLYFEAFPSLGEWHTWTRQELRAKGHLTTLFGRRRHFFGRLNDDHTLKEALAYQAQSMTAHEIDQGYMSLWQKFPEVELLVQVHDSILFQVPEASLPRLGDYLRAMEVHLEVGGRDFFVPLEAEVGYNWGKASALNPKGLSVWAG